ncbi:MAG: hypothetical protein HQL32_05745, partial [Planctomycetes bacterium]|nr:hypothetical protein [Planctomycetota bacterium]
MQYSAHLCFGHTVWYYGELYADGDVGIGTTSPAYKLDVSGTGRFTGTVTAPTFSGNATTAAALQTARTIALTGDVTGSATFDGSGNIS